MPLDIARIRKLLADFNFKLLFIEELGWNRHETRLDVQVDGRAFTLSAVAVKCGMAVFICNPGVGGQIPDDRTRRKIERQVTKLAYEHLIVFLDAAKNQQYWLWSRRETGRQPVLRGEWFRCGETGERLAQKIRHLSVSLEEEEKLTLPDVTGRARKAFDVERVTKKFYDRFKTEHAAFLKFLEGIPDGEMERWYVSVMLNRLMFIYFIQKKGFLGGDPDYLKNKLALSRREIGKDRYYRDFLCPLFFEGFAKQEDERTEKAQKLLGEVPYLNGGIFLPHQIENLYGRTIAIPDAAFEKLFEFFDAYHWHLDERPLKSDNEINPDVLGYIFEKYINQKQMGAYYTKEDITGYISQNTVIPFLINMAREKCKVAFEGERPVWRLLAEDPDRYIYSAVKHGVVLEDGSVVPETNLPDFVRVGMYDPKARMHDKRYNLHQAPADDMIRLVTETWREYVYRRTHCLEIREKLQTGEVCNIDDLIIYNFDIRRFVQDMIENSEGPELLIGFWKAIQSVTVLDPTCGSGAFLFAALNILDPLYEACLERMRFFLDEWGEDGKKNHPNYHKLFVEILKRMEEHTNRRYFVLKSIIVNNLFGVDIMEEAVETCKLRLFLKLVAQVEVAEKIEPLPDIDFNIRAGNSLVGFSSLTEVKQTLDRLPLGFDEHKNDVFRIEEDAEIAYRAFCKFREMQTEQGMPPCQFAEAKEELRSRLKKLTDELDRFLAGEYGINDSNIPNKLLRDEAFMKWRKSHQPFHWFAEFFGIVNEGGFDVIIGNPPYVEYKQVRSEYLVKGYATENCGNLYAFAFERAITLIRSLGRVGLIIPVSSVSTEGYVALRQLWCLTGNLIISNFNDRPGKLFDGLEHIRLAIVIYTKDCRIPRRLHVSRYMKWLTESRGNLFQTLAFTDMESLMRGFDIPKCGSRIESSILSKCSASRRNLNYFASHGGTTPLYYTRKLSHFVQVLDFIPCIVDGKGREQRPSELKEISFPSKKFRDVYLSVLNSTFFYWLLTVWSDCRNLNKREVQGVPFDIDAAQKDIILSLEMIARGLMEDYRKNARMLNMQYKEWGNMKIQCIYPKYSKPLIDEIDRVLAKHYGFTEEELDFIINYDIKFRMGQGMEKEDEE